MLLQFSGAAFFLWLVRNVYTMSVITVDDQDPSITYAPTLSSWGKVYGPGIDAGGTHMVSTDSVATATLTGRFLNAHFWSARWPYHVTTDISIDGGTFTVDLQDPNAPEQPIGGGATVASSVVFSFFGTTSQEHTIVLSMHPGDLYVVMDRFTFDVEDNSTVNTVTSLSIAASTVAVNTGSSIISSTPWEATYTPQPSSSTSTKLGNVQEQKSTIVPVIVAVVVVALALALTGLIIFVICRRSRRPKPTRFLSDKVFDQRYKRRVSRDSFISDGADTHWTQPSVMRHANLSLSPVPAYSRYRPYEESILGQGYDANARISTSQTDPSAYQTIATPPNALRVMNNARSGYYSSDVTLNAIPISPSNTFKQMRKLSPRAVNPSFSAGYRNKGPIIVDADGNACWKSYTDNKALTSEDGQWSTKKSLEQQEDPYILIPPPPYQVSESRISSTNTKYLQPLKFRSIT